MAPHSNNVPVRGSKTEVRTIQIDLDVTPVKEHLTDNGETEFRLVVNGHLIRRMNVFQAERLGLVVRDEF
jgi:hypothetical protein